MKKKNFGLFVHLLSVIQILSKMQEKAKAILARWREAFIKGQLVWFRERLSAETHACLPDVNGHRLIFECILYR